MEPTGSAQARPDDRLRRNPPFADDEEAGYRLRLQPALWAAVTRGARITDCFCLTRTFEFRRQLTGSRCAEAGLSMPSNTFFIEAKAFAHGRHKYLNVFQSFLHR